MIRFSEVFRCAGVDQDTRHLGMVIANKGENLVGVVHDNLKIKVYANTSALTVDEPAYEPIMRQRINLNIDLSQPSVDKGYRDAYMPDTYFNDTRVFRVKASRRLDFNSGAKIIVAVDGKKKAAMPVVVLDPMPLKVAICDVKVPDGKGGFRLHGSKSVDATKELKIVNGIWTPQTQIVFEQVAAQPATIDDRDPKVRALIAKCLDIKDLQFANFNSVVEPSKLAPVFASHRVAGADVTVFYVDKVKGSDGRIVNGNTQSPHGMIFMSAVNAHSTLAHELGHYFGGKRNKGIWDGFAHTHDYEPYQKGREPKLSDEDYRMLMRDGGAGYKIPFDLVDDFRDFKGDFAKK
jgi:hypothetical protein